MLKIHQYAIMCAPTMSQYAAAEAAKNGDEDIDYMISQYDQRRKLIVSELRGMGLPCFEPQGAFYAVSYTHLPVLKDAALQRELNRMALQANDQRYRAYLLEMEALALLEREVLAAE